MKRTNRGRSKTSRPYKGMLRHDSPLGLISQITQQAFDTWGAGFGLLSVAGRSVAPRPFFYAEKREAALSEVIDGLNADDAAARFLIGFCLVRRELLGKSTPSAKVDTLRVLDWSRGRLAVPDPRFLNKGYERVTEARVLNQSLRWTHEDVTLLQATCLFLTRSIPANRQSALELLEKLSYAGDPTVAFEAAVLWMRILLEADQEKATEPMVLTQGQFAIPFSLVTASSTGIVEVPSERADREVTAEDKTHLAVLRLLEASSKIPTSAASLSPHRVSSFIEAFEEGDLATARRQLDCRLPDDVVKVSATTTITSRVTTVQDLEQFVTTAVNGTFSKKQDRKIRHLTLDMENSQFTRSEWHRVAIALIKLGSNSKNSKAWLSTVEALIYRLFINEQSDPGKHAQTLLELSRFYTRLVLDKDDSYPIHHAHFATHFAKRAFKKTSKSSPAAREAALTYLLASRLYSNLTSSDVDAYEAIEVLDITTPRGTRERRGMASMLGTFLSGTCSEDLLASPYLAAKLRSLWMENLEYVRIDAHSWNNKVDKGTLSWALREAAVANRVYSMTRPEESRISALSEALKLAEEAVLLFPTTRSRLIYSYILNEYSAYTYNTTDFLVAANLQKETLDSFLDRFSDEFVPSQSEDSNGLLPVVFVPDEEAAPEAFATYMRFLNWAMSSGSGSSLLTLAFHAAEGARLHYQTGHYEGCASLVTAILPHLYKPLTAGTMPYRALHTIQGITALGAAAYARLNEARRALGLLELGTTLASRPKENRTLNIQAAIEDCSATVLQLTRRLEQPVIYLAALHDAGLAITVHEGQTAISWLDGLCEAQVSRWLESLVPRDSPRASDVTRGPRGTTSPPHQTVASIVKQARHAVLPLADSLQPEDTIHVIPTGINAGLPWGPIFNRPATTTPSGALLYRAHNRPELPASGRTVIANPSPINYNGKLYADLPSAVQEAADLHRDFHFNVPLTGSNATKQAFDQAMGQGLDILHIATHAEVDPYSWGANADILWANNPRTGKSETTPARRPPHTQKPPRTVFLAACSGAATDRILPDEAIGFPTALLTSGVSTVIAPLWPISDRVTTDFVNMFYAHLESGADPARALHLAAQTDDPSELPTFSAFIITGNNSPTTPSSYLAPSNK